MFQVMYNAVDLPIAGADMWPEVIASRTVRCTTTVEARTVRRSRPAWTPAPPPVSRSPASRAAFNACVGEPIEEVV